MPLTGERKPFTVLQSSFDEIEGQFSPNGQWLACASNESGRYDIYIRTFPETGGKQQVSVEGGVQPRWQRDGSQLFYVAPDTRLMAVPISLGPGTHTLEAGAPVPLVPTRLDGRKYHDCRASGPRAVCRRPRRPVFDEHRRRRCGRVADHPRAQLDGGTDEMSLTAGSRPGPSNILVCLCAAGVVRG